MSIAAVLWIMRVVIGIAGVQVFRWGREHHRREILIGGVLLCATPWFFNDLTQLLLFEAGIAIPVALLMRRAS